MQGVLEVVVAVAVAATLVLGYRTRQMTIEASRRAGAARAAARAAGDEAPDDHAQRESALSLIGVAVVLAVLGLGVSAASGEPGGLVMAGLATAAGLGIAAVLARRS